MPLSPPHVQYSVLKLTLQYIFNAVKKSLERLQLDHIDVLQCHRFDPETPIEETMQALHDVVKAGYVRYIGMSSCYAWQCACLFRVNNLFVDLCRSSCHAE
jgi:aryl-alcohol dehydrogenase-like predicted oxidoreductase